MIDKTREIALKIVYKIDKEDAYSNIELNEQIKQNRKNLTEKDIGLISEIVYGVTTWRLTLDEIIKKYSKIKIKKISPWILNILRKIEKNDYEEFFKIEDDIERISKTTSMPKWIVEELMKSNDEKEVEQICKNSNIKPKVTIRVNTLKINKQELIERLKEKNTECKETAEKLDDFLILEKVKNIENVEEFKQGYFTIQDISAGQTAKILNPQPGELVLDACSAPGGKTTYMAELMKNKGKIEAWDIHEHRTKLVEQNAQRLGINIIETKVKDASLYDESLKEKFDKILLDVPCLGIGVIKRKPDIKWKRKPEDVKNITEIQKKILDNCSKYLKKNGVMVYSTCSILEKENQDIVDKFLKENNEYYIRPEETRNILPNEEKDGFFICKIYRK